MYNSKYKRKEKINTRLSRNPLAFARVVPGSAYMHNEKVEMLKNGTFLASWKSRISTISRREHPLCQFASII